MKSSKTIWGISLIAIGILLVLNNLNLVEFGFNWHRFGDFWPLLLIAFGLTSLTKSAKINPWISNSLLALVISFFLYNTIEIGDHNKESFSWSNNRDRDEKASDQNFTLPLDSGITSATFELNGGASEFRISDTTFNLIDAKSHLNVGEYTLEKVNEGSSESIKLMLNDDKDVKGKFNFDDEHWDSYVDVKLNPDILWNLKFQLGAGDVNFDFSNFKVSSIDMDAGAASVDMKLSSLAPTTDVKIDAGATDIKIFVPKDAKCTLKLNTVLSSKEFIGFIDKGDGTYESENFAESKGNLITISLDAGVSNVEIKRY